MSKELRLSKSKINTFIECPRKFKYRYIDEITEEPNKYMQFGTYVHEIAENVANKLMENEYVDKQIIDDAFKSINYDAEFEADQHLDGLKKFFYDIYSNGYQIFAAEDLIYDEKQNLVGIIDIVIEKKDTNELIIFDYKTGRPGPITRYKLELCVYKRLLECRYPEHNIISGGIYFTGYSAYRIANFEESKEDYFTSKSKENIKETDFNYVSTVSDKIYETIERKYFMAKKGFMCKYCFYKKRCDNDLF